METALINTQFRSKKAKIFGIGLSRTGTKSLTAALNRLGFSIIHYPNDEVTQEELITGKYNFSLLNNHDGITDITMSPYYVQMDSLYPGSKFILTVRDKEAWLQGIERHWERKTSVDYPYQEKSKKRLLNQLLGLKRKQEEEKIRKAELRRFLRAATYGIYRFNRERLYYVYDLHYKNATEYFKDRPDSLLVLDITAGQGWTELCGYLGLPVINEPFPHH